MDVSELLAEAQPLDVPLPGGGSVHVEYRPAAVTVENISKLDAAAATGSATKELLEYLGHLIVSWDITHEGEPIDPRNPELMAKVPLPFLTLVIQQAQQRQAVGETSAGTSA